MASIINAATSGGLVTTADTSGILQLQTAGTTAVTVDAAGGVKTLNTISVGNATPSASGAGITFPATQSASADANTLDDYEEGTWTPTLGGNTTYSDAVGSYVKIGQVVTVQCAIVVSTLGTGSTTQISGLPFTCSGVNGYRTSGSVAYFADLAVSTISLVCGVPASNTIINFSGRASSSATISDSLAIFGNSTHVQLSITYRSGA